jgi:hypothetical protein
MLSQTDPRPSLFGFLSSKHWPAVSGRQMLLGAGVILTCLVFGFVTANFTKLFGSSPAKLAVLPILLVVLMLFALNPLKFFLGALLLRSAGDLVFDSMRLPIGGGAGLGGLLNFMMLGIAVIVVIKDKPQASRKHVMLWLLLLLGLLEAVAVSPLRSDAIRLYVGMLTNFAVFVIAFHVKPRGESALKFGASLTIWSSVLPTLYGLYQAAGGMGGGRLASTFAHPNIYAFYLVLVLTLLLYVLRSSDWQLSSRQRATVWSYFLLQSAMLGLTMTRSAWIGYAVVVGVYALLYERKWLIFLVLLPVIGMMVPSIRDRVMDLGEGNEVVQYAKLNSFAWRVALWQSAFAAMDLKAYLIGNGLESFRVMSVSFFSMSGGTLWGSHSVFVQVIFELGLLGCIPAVLLYVRVFKDGLITSRREKVAGFTVMAIVIQYLVTAAADNLLYYLVYNWYFWFVLGCAAADTFNLASPSRGEPKLV